MNKVEDYIKNTWEIFPLYQFYELDIPLSNKNVIIYSTLALTDIELKKEYTSKFFIIYGVYPKVNKCIGNVFIKRKDAISRISAHSISACSEIANKEYIKNTFKIRNYSNNFLELISYGNEAEIITDLGKVLQVYIEEKK